MVLNTLYTSANGEANPFGIGSITLFVRLQGCNIRCFKKTLGVLCDTPEALEREGGCGINGWEDIAKYTIEKAKAEGVRLACLSGGEPLWNKPEDIKSLLKALTDAGLEVTIETSGTLDWLPYQRKGVYFIVDYKLRSAGIDKRSLISKNREQMGSKDYIKFVVYGEEDYKEMIELLPDLYNNTSARITAGPYWGGGFSPLSLFDRLSKDKMLRYLSGGINSQCHKHWALPIPENFNFEQER